MSLLVHASDVSTKSRTLRIVTNLPVGSAPDVYVRKVAAELEPKLQKSIIVENKPGGAGLVGLEHYLNQPADGNTIFFGDFGVFVSTPNLYKKEHLYNQIKPLTIGYFAHWLIVSPPHIKNLNELQQEIKKNPNFGSWAVGSGGHLCGAEFSQLVGVNAQHIPYKDQSVWLADIASGRLPFGCTSIGSSESLYSAGKLNYIAVASNRRDRYYPSIPTVKELTGHNFQTGEVWSAFYINVKTSDDTTKMLESTLREINRSPTMIELVNNIKATAGDLSSRDMDRLRSKDLNIYKTLINKYNISIEQ
jgi:tripartite-type tricarboxylate transporter receptor subunit TctC